MKLLIESFIKFQSELKPVVKDVKNEFFKSKYANLSAVLEEVLPLLTKHGLSVTQICRICDQGTIIQTKLMHISGSEMISEMPLNSMPDVQKMGSQITYLKRYSIMAMLGVSTADEDDDGNKASYNPPKDNRKFETKPIEKAAEKPADNKPKPLQQEMKDDGILLNQITERLGALTKGLTKEEKAKFMKDKLGISSFGDIMKMRGVELSGILFDLN